MKTYTLDQIIKKAITDNEFTNKEISSVSDLLSQLGGYLYSDNYQIEGVEFRQTDNECYEIWARTSGGELVNTSFCYYETENEID